jgi:osmotically-inducible protein OsmY
MRRINSALIVVCLSVMVVAAGCSRSDRTGTTARNGGVSNSDLERMVKEKLTSDPQLNTTDIKVSADADHNQIKLSGTVPSEDLRTKAIDIAKSVQPDASITDTIDVKPHEMARVEDQGAVDRNANNPYDRTNSGRTDEAIRSQIESKLNSDPALAADNVKVDVSKDNVVTLKGTVKSGEEKARAQKLAERIDGVAQVRNDLKVKGDK